MKSDFLIPISIVIGSLLISAAIYFHPAPAHSSHPPYAPCQVVAVEGFLYVIDSEKGELRKIIPTK
ncbi:MAG: hypothetical protein ABI615_03435 [Chthoniobacterales bacterium]